MKIYENSGNYARGNWYVKINGEDYNTFSISSHQWTNPKMVDGEMVQYRHQHTTFYTGDYVVGMEHALDITWGEKENQVKVSLPFVVNNKLVMRGTDNRYYEITCNNLGVHSTQIDSDEVIRANKDKRPHNEN